MHHLVLPHLPLPPLASSRLFSPSPITAPSRPRPSTSLRLPPPAAAASVTGLSPSLLSSFIPPPPTPPPLFAILPPPAASARVHIMFALRP
ncbi:hypothetical protein E2C01_085205 [Portunus trituberculatus]|uniref:Uncharacterized protein n=1 Tax=Portunus trituberculatus TaxID=210409 RepID=A0A5B7IX99_PORTR|nr:hypothetical protein [Portunus trituberculatus]